MINGMGEKEGRHKELTSQDIRSLCALVDTLENRLDEYWSAYAYMLKRRVKSASANSIGVAIFWCGQN